MKPKIAHIANTVGGVDVWLRTNLPEIDNDAFDLFVIKGLEGRGEPYYTHTGDELPCYQVPIQREISLVKDFKAVVQTVKILKKEKPTLIHAHSAKGGVIARVASLFYKTKVLYTPHAFSYLSAQSGFKKKLFLAIEKVFKNINSILVACSVSEQQRGINEVGYKKTNTRVYENAIAPLPSVVITKNTPQKDYICTIGRPSYQKNIEHLVAVVKQLKEKLPKIHLIVLGVGEYSPNKKQVEDQIKKHKLEDHITLVPWMDRAKVFQYVKNSQLYISAARYEGLPYAVIEALALGKACVVTDCDGNRDLIKNEYNGYVVPQNDVVSMANCIFALLVDESKRIEIEKNALDYFETHHNISSQIKNLEAIYNQYST